MLVPLAVTLFLGFALTVVGLRGRRVDDHPLCRRCRFDLTGRPNDAERRCPECGADLARPRAVVVGHRRRRAGVLAVGLGLVTVTTTAGGWWAASRYRQVDWLRHAPLAYLIYMASSPNPSRRAAPLVELQRREDQSLDGHGRLTAADLDRVLDAGLAYQADAAKPWDPAWGDLIEKARASGRLTDGRWSRYGPQAFAHTFHLRLRPQVRRGDPLPHAVYRSVPRVGTASSLSVEPGDLAIHWNGKSIGPIELPPFDRFEADVMPVEWPTAAVDGVQSIRVTGEVGIDSSIGESVADTFVVASFVGTATFNDSGQFTLSPADQSTVTTTPAPVLASAVGQAIRLVRDGSPWTQLSVCRPPVGVSFDVWVREGNPRNGRGRERRVGSIACPAGGEAYRNLLLPEPPVELWFRTDPSAAAATVDTSRVWDGEIVVRE